VPVGKSHPAPNDEANSPTHICILRCLYTGSVGKRSRKRRRDGQEKAGEQEDGVAPARLAPRWGARLTRVRLDDSEWAAVTELAAGEGIPISEFLGRIVRRSLAHRALPRRAESKGPGDPS
jgi:hypothetical protein